LRQAPGVRYQALGAGARVSRYEKLSASRFLPTAWCLLPYCDRLRQPALAPPALCNTPAMRQSWAGLPKSLGGVRWFSRLRRLRRLQLGQGLVHALLEVFPVVVLGIQWRKTI